MALLNGLNVWMQHTFFMFHPGGCFHFSRSEMVGVVLCLPSHPTRWHAFARAQRQVFREHVCFFRNMLRKRKKHLTASFAAVSIAPNDSSCSYSDRW